MATGNQTHRIERLANRLLNGSGDKPGLLSRWVGHDLRCDQDRLSDFLTDVRRLLPFAVDRDVLRASCGDLLRQPITLGQLRFWCRRIAAHRESLEGGQWLPRWSGVSRATNVSAEILHVKPGQSPERELGWILTCRVLDSSACGLEFEHWIPQYHLSLLARKLDINSWHNRVGRFSGHSRELVGMRLVGNLRPRQQGFKRSTVDLIFDRIRVGSFWQHNRRLARARAQPCPEQFTWTCFQCSLGLDQCPTGQLGGISRACRPITLTMETCAACQKQEPHEFGQCMACRRANPPMVRQSPTGVLLPDPPVTPPADVASEQPPAPTQA